MLLSKPVDRQKKEVNGMRQRIPQCLARTNLLFFCLFCLLFTLACNRKSKPVTKVTVAGDVAIKVEPDAAVLVLSVVTQNPQAITAQQQNARKSDAVASAVKAAAGSNTEIKTSDYVLQPQYDPRYNRLPRIIGYDARNSIIITITDLKNV